MSTQDQASAAFLKQAAEAFQQTAQAEAQGRMAKALERYCGASVPPTDLHSEAFQARCQLYAAKAYAMAHIDGQITWGGLAQELHASGAWPPSLDSVQGNLFYAFALGFLLGNELPQDRHDHILSVLPMAARVAADPDAAARDMGMTPEQMREMAAGGQGPSGGGFDPMKMAQSLGVNPAVMQQIMANPMGFAKSMGLTPEKMREMMADPKMQAMMRKFMGGKSS